MLQPISLHAATGGQRLNAKTRLTLPLLFEGAYQGDVPVQVEVDGSISVDVDRFITLLGRRLSAELSAKIKAEAGPDATVPLAKLATVGISAVYDVATLELRVSIPVAKQGAQSLSAYSGPRSGDGEPTITQAPFAGALILTARQTYRWGSAGSPAAFQPVRVAGDLALNIGGASGVSLFSQGEFDGSNGGRFRRGNSILIYDDPKRAIRYSAGDVAPLSAGLQTSPLIGGISIERQFGTLQPFRNIRPSGQLSFVVERPSTIDVVVNGATLRTIQLDAGQYNLGDFPFFNGLNQVELYSTDQYGRRLLASFSQYFSARLLDRGILEFGATGGVLQRTSGVGARYLGERPTFTGFARYGLTNNLTVGANVQLTANQWMVGGELGFATPIGTVGVLASLSQYNGLGQGSSFLVSYEASAKRIGPFERPQLNLQVQATSRNFTPLTLTVPLNRYSLQAQGRLSSQLPAGFGGGVSISYFKGRDGQPDQTRYGATLSRRVGKFTFTASYDRLDTIGTQRESRFLLTASLPLGRSQSLRTSYDTRANTATIEYAKFQRDEVDTIGIRAVVTRTDRLVSGNGQISYNNNRFSMLVEHNIIAQPNLNAVQSQQTSYTFATQLAFAGNAFAIGRPVGPRFAIVSAHPTLEDAVVSVRQGPGRAKPQARTGALGNGLAPAGNAYTVSQINVDVDKLPVGYDIGPGTYGVRPGAAAGYAITVGSDASRVVIGTAYDAKGEVIKLQGGTLTSLDSTKALPILLFTNRNGRFVATGVAPGRYMLAFGANGRDQAIVTISKDSKGTIEIGTVTLTQGATPK